MHAEAADPRLHTCLSSPLLPWPLSLVRFGATRLVLLSACLLDSLPPPLLPRFTPCAAPWVPGVDPNLQHDLYADSHLPSFHRDARVLHELGATTLLLDRWCVPMPFHASEQRLAPLP